MTNDEKQAVVAVDMLMRTLAMMQVRPVGFLRAMEDELLRVTGDSEDKEALLTAFRIFKTNAMDLPPAMQGKSVKELLIDSFENEQRLLREIERKEEDYQAARKQINEMTRKRSIVGMRLCEKIREQKGTIEALENEVQILRDQLVDKREVR